MKDKIIKLARKPFVRNVVILSSGTAGAQVVAMVLSPIITRLYGPEAYGLMGTFTAIISIVAPIAAFTYPVSIVLPKHDRDAKGLIRLSLLIALIFSVSVGLTLYFFQQPIITLFHLEDIAPYLYLIPIIILSSGFLQVIEQWLIRTKQFGVSAKATFLQAILINGGKVGIGAFYPAASVLILFSALKEGLKAFLLFLLTRKNKFKPMFNFKKEKLPIKKLAKAYKDFPLYRAPQTVVNSISVSVPVLLLASFFGSSSVGFYNIGRTVLDIPTQLLGKSIGDVFYPQITNVANKGGNVSAVIRKATLILIGVGLIPYGTVILFGPILFSIVFGSDWVVAGEYARWIALWSFSTFILQPAMRALPVLSAQRFHLIYTVFSLVVRMTMLGLGYYLFHSDIIAIALFGISSGLMNLILIGLTLRVGKRYDNSIRL